MAILQQVDGKTFYEVPDEKLDQYAIPQNKLGERLKSTGVILGTNVSPEEVKGKKVLRSQDRPKDETADAKAQYLRRSVAICPNCYHRNLVWEETTEYRLFECGWCSYVFRF